jgi:hypothetical protein
MFEYINPADLHKHWDFVRKGCEVVKVKTGENWLPEDVYTAIKTNSAQLFLFADGFCVLQHIKDAYNNENVLHIWVAYHSTREDIKEASTNELIKIAKSIGARTITFTSPRKWDLYTGAKVKSVNYEIEVSP